jgi:hypothetical protein
MYMDFFKNSLPAIAEFHAKKISPNGRGILLAAFWNGEPCGALSAGPQNEGVHAIFHFAAAEPCRKRGVCTTLLDSALSRLKSSGVCTVEAAVQLSAPFYAVVDAMLKKNGFKEIKTVTTVVNYYSDDITADFYDFKRKKWDKLAARLVARGYAAKSFAESDEREIQMLKDEMGVSFPENLSPFRPGVCILEDVSFIVFKDGSPVAYCVMTDFENIPGVSAVSSRASSPKVGHSGVAMWAFMRCLEEAILSGQFSKTIFMFDSDNAEMVNLKDGPPTRYKGAKSSVSQIYRLCLNDGD